MNGGAGDTYADAQAIADFIGTAAEGQNACYWSDEGPDAVKVGQLRLPR